MSDYYKDLETSLSAALDRLAVNAPELLELATRDEAPHVLLRCKPHGHEMLTVTLSKDWNHYTFYVTPVHEELEQPVKVASGAAPSLGGNVCWEPGCGSLTARGETHCEDHLAAGYNVDEVHATRTVFKCSRCAFSEPKLSTTLLGSYVEAYLRGLRQIRIR